MDSKTTTPLKTDSPDFESQFSAAIQRGYAAVNRSIRSSNALPTGAARDLFTTFPSFQTIAHKLKARAVRQLARAANPGYVGRINKEYDLDKIIDVNDNLLEQILAGIEGRLSVPVTPNTEEGAISVNSRPQLAFEEPIDNSKDVFVPKITHKDNAIEPFELKHVRSDDGELIGYEHPYRAELEAYNPPPHLLLDDNSPIEPPPPPERTPFTFVTTKAQLDELVKHLATVDEIAVDLEHHSIHSYRGFTCLVQITTSGGDWIIDALALRSHIKALNASFTDPNKLKVLHGADNDVLWLQRDFGVYIVGLFDTHQAARTLCFPQLGLKYLLSRYCNIGVDKNLARSDWRLRPLSEPLLAYARGDTHSLLYIWKRLRRELLEGSRGVTALQSVFQASQRVAAKVYHGNSTERESWHDLDSRASRWLDARQRAALLALHRWRDQAARAADESPWFIAPTHTLLALSTALPRELQGAAAICASVPRLRNYLPHLHRLVLACRELPAGPAPTLSAAPSSAPTSVAPTTSPHDLHQAPEPRKQPITAPTNGKRSHDKVTPPSLSTPDVTVFDAYPPTPQSKAKNTHGLSRLFVPPYDRYRTYRYLAQVEELKQYKAKAAKAALIAKEDKDLIPNTPVHEYVPPEKRIKT